MLSGWDRRRAEWERVLREAFPLDLPPDRAFYAVDDVDAGPEVARDMAHSWAATSPSLDLRLRLGLESRGQWRGRGFAVVFPMFDWLASRFSDDDLLGFLAHEFAHHLDHERYWAEAGEFGDVLATIAPEELAGMMRELAARPRPPWDQHEVRFTRAALHLHHRLTTAGHPVKLAAMLVAGPLYELSPAATYRDALGDELHDRASEPIRDILDSPAPAAMLELWQADTATRGG